MWLNAQLAVKDEYTFAFVELEDAHSEQQFERALTDVLRVSTRDGRHVHLCRKPVQDSGGGRDFFIDLLLYHRRLHASGP